MTHQRFAMISSQHCTAWAALALFLCLAAAAPANEPQPTAAAEPTPEQVQSLIDGLGHDSFARREQAMHELIAAGAAVEEEVTAAVSHGDPEVRYRAAKVLREIEKSQIAERRQRFIDGDTAAMKLNAASWKRLAEVLGNTRESRQLFVQMQAEGGALLDELDSDPARCAGEIATLYQKEMLARRGGRIDGLQPGLVLAVVFAAGQPEVKLDPATTSRAISLLYRVQGKFAQDKEPLLRQLLGRWINKEGTDVNTQFQFLRLAQQFKLPQGLDLARKLISSAPHASYRAQAIMMVAELGGAEDIPAIEKMIGDSTSLAVVVKNGKRTECKLGDVALAMCILLSDQKLKDFGFQDAPEGRPLHPIFNQYNIQDEARAAARAKWAEFRKSQAAAK